MQKKDSARRWRFLRLLPHILFASVFLFVITVRKRGAVLPSSIDSSSRDAALFGKRHGVEHISLQEQRIGSGSRQYSDAGLQLSVDSPGEAVKDSSNGRGSSYEGVEGKTAAASDADDNYPWSTFAFSATFSVHWRQVARSDPKALEFIMASNASGWFGMGLGSQQMIYADFIVVGMDPGKTKFVLIDGYQPTSARGIMEDTSLPGGESDLELISIGMNVTAPATLARGRYMARFTRVLNPADLWDAPIRPGPMPVIWAQSMIDMNYQSTGHGPSFRGAAAISFLDIPLRAKTPNVAIQSTHAMAGGLLFFHTFVMFSVFGLMFPVGAFVAKYPNGISHWLGLHKHMMAEAVAHAMELSVATLFGSDFHSDNLHAVLAIFIGAIILLQVVVGNVTTSVFSAVGGTDEDPITLWIRKHSSQTRKFHKYAGMLVLILGFVEMGNGFYIMFEGSSHDQTVAMAVFATYLICVILADYFLGHKGLYAKMAKKSRRRRKAKRAKKKSRKTTVLPDGKSKRRLTTLTEEGGDDDDDDDDLLMKMTCESFVENVEAGEQWIVIENKVIDVKAFMDNHPGGKAVISKSIGCDVTANFYGRVSAPGKPSQSPSPTKTKSLLNEFYEARSKPASVEPTQGLPSSSPVVGPPAGVGRLSLLPLQIAAVGPPPPKPPMAGHKHSKMAEYNIFTEFVVGKLVSESKKRTHRPEKSPGAAPKSASSASNATPPGTPTKHLAPSTVASPATKQLAPVPLAQTRLPLIVPTTRSGISPNGGAAEEQHTFNEGRNAKLDSNTKAKAYSASNVALEVLEAEHSESDVETISQLSPIQSRADVAELRSGVLLDKKKSWGGPGAAKVWAEPSAHTMDSNGLPRAMSAANMSAAASQSGPKQLLGATVKASFRSAGAGLRLTSSFRVEPEPAENDKSLPGLRLPDATEQRFKPIPAPEETPLSPVAPGAAKIKFAAEAAAVATQATIAGTTNAAQTKTAGAAKSAVVAAATKFIESHKKIKLMTIAKTFGLLRLGKSTGEAQDEESDDEEDDTEITGDGGGTEGGETAGTADDDGFTSEYTTDDDHGDTTNHTDSTEDTTGHTAPPSSPSKPRKAS